MGLPVVDNNEKCDDNEKNYTSCASWSLGAILSIAGNQTLIGLQGTLIGLQGSAQYRAKIL